ncbi:YhgE/Pip family protein [uncultured Friedmanniella sp.]|uniref:YhgE/Pip domain-containing protein n=1 Tax=uncultured Friedmanniella sp. TaxID=335381 RepID=UPI0035CBCFE9
MYSLERASSTSRVGLWSVLGLVLVPLLVAAGFLWATWDSSTRLDRVQAAVVNLDDPVKLQGQTVPLGRQLAGGLVAGNVDQNFDWVLTDEADASAGLSSGAYAAVVTIPKTFSARATSFSRSDPADMRAATIGVQTSDVAGISDPVVGQAITAAATKVLNTSLTREYLQNIYLGFNSLSKQFGTVADASGKLTDGTDKLAEGLDGVSSGTGDLADGLDQLGTGAGQLATGTQGLATGTTRLADGLDKLADGAAKVPPGARKLAKGSQQAADGADQLADGMKGIAGGLATYQKALRTQAAQQAKVPPPATGGQLPCPTTEPALTAAQCQVVLQTIGAVAQQAGKSAGAYAGAQGAAKALEGAAAGLSTKDPKTGQSLIGGANALADGQAKAAKGLQQLADGTDSLADGLKPLAKGIRSSADGTATLASGAEDLSTATTQLATGTKQSATGAAKLADGTDQLADGAHKLADGSQKLSDGLAKGAKAVPTYDKTTRQKLSSVVTTPVSSKAPTSAFSNVTTTTFLAVLALWLGALASYLVLRAVSARVVSSMKPSWRLSAEGLLPGAVIGAVQAIALAVVLQLLLHLSAGRAVELGSFAVLTALAFVALNHALVAWFGGVGRFVSVALVVVGAAGAVTSAVPESFDALRPFLPLTPALDGFRAIASGGAGAGAAAALLGAWLVLGLVAGVVAVARRRVVAPLVAPLPA